MGKGRGFKKNTEKMATYSQVESGCDKELRIVKLPPEMLVKVLMNVETRSLFACRLVNRQWSAISSEILCTRPEFEIVVDFSNNRGFQIRTRKYGEQSLKKFVECFKSSKNCPFARFYIRDDNSLARSKFWNRDEWFQFLSDFNLSKIKGLKLRTSISSEKKAVADFVEMFRDLFLNKFPNIEDFGCSFRSGFDSSGVKIQIQTKLFGSRHGGNGSKTSSPSPSSSVVLPQLKVFYLGNSMCSGFPGIVKDLLNSAPNLKHIRPFPNDSENLDAESFLFLDSMGKLELLRSAPIRLTDDFLLRIRNVWENLSAQLKLKEVKLMTDFIFRDPVQNPNPNLWAQATHFISTLFEANGNRLLRLTLEPVSFLNSPQLPTFTNLQVLSLVQHKMFRASSPQIFPPGVNSQDMFPAVQFLNLDIYNWQTAFPHEDTIPRLSLVTHFTFMDEELKAQAVSVLALMCPNMTSLKITQFKGESSSDFLKVGREIWTHMPKLESLEVDIHLDSDLNLNLDLVAMRYRPNYSPSLDSCFTGISRTECRRLYQMMEANKILKRWESQVQIPESELTAEREFPSILDMKDLKQLIINPYFKGKLLPQRKFFNEVLSWVSRDYAFKLMPHLKLRTEKEHSK